MTNTKLIKGKYKGYEVCFAKKGQIFPRDGWYLTKGSNVIYLEDAMEKVRQKTISEIIKSVEENQKGQFENDGGIICWYLNELLDLLNKILYNIKK